MLEHFPRCEREKVRFVYRDQGGHSDTSLIVGLTCKNLAARGRIIEVLIAVGRASGAVRHGWTE